jgi:hypothetical protein
MVSKGRLFLLLLIRKLLVARERFELSSKAPEALMLDHYTNGLQVADKHRSLLLTLTLLFFLFQRFPNAVAFLANTVIAVAVPKRVHDGVFVLSIAG